MLNLSKAYTPKQLEILRACRNTDWFLLINHGAKRSGKTQLDNDIFLQELIRVRKTADKLGIDTPQYILAGYSMGNIQDIAAFQNAGINAYMGNNRVLSGIEAVATLMTNKQFFIVYSQCPRFREEIYKYIWKKNTGEPLKENDDVLCAIRYGIYSDMTVNEIELPGQSMAEQAEKLKGMF